MGEGRNYKFLTFFIVLKFFLKIDIKKMLRDHNKLCITFEKNALLTSESFQEKKRD